MSSAVPSHNLARTLTIVVLVATAVGLSSAQTNTHLAEVQRRGELRAALPGDSTSVDRARPTPAAFEHHLIKAFADHLGVEPKVVTPSASKNAEDAVRSGHADMAVSSPGGADSALRTLRFELGRDEGYPVLVYGPTANRPESLEEVSPDKLRIITEPETAVRLHTARGGPFHPSLRVALTLTGSGWVTWSFPTDPTTSLQDAAWRFLSEARDDGTLAELQHRYFGYARYMNAGDYRLYAERMLSRLPEHLHSFRRAGRTTGVDWRLLAAVSYQESHWNPDAVSFTGVRGMMMLTRETARYMDVHNRRDPRQSIAGGARYLRELRARLPESIDEPDRTWMALAAYNVGLGHLSDARRITRRQGNDPDRWFHVRQHLPLLTQPQWYRQTRYGEARGREPVIYVARVRAFYNVLARFTSRLEVQRAAGPGPALTRETAAASGKSS